MKQFVHLLMHDFRLLQRNNIIVISIAVSALYVGAFIGLSTLGDIEKFLILTIFNDPALLGFLFIGVMVLFEKNEMTLQALAVTPMNFHHYLLSKALSLTVVAVGCCVAMVLAANGWAINWIHFVSAAFLATMLFSFIGFGVVAGQSTFNGYLLPAVGVLVFLSLPFLGYFEVVPKFWFFLFPDYPVIELFQFAFAEQTHWGPLVLHYGLAVCWCLITYHWAYKRIQRDFMMEQ